MDRVNKVLFHPQYQQYYQEIQSLEADRKFCGHTIDHFLAVARLSFIMVQEAGLDIDKEVVYAAALLHDIGRYLEYTKGTPHHEGSVLIAQELLPECGFNDTEIAIIIQAIKGHREAFQKRYCKAWDEELYKLSDADNFAAIFNQADKLSRNCFACSVADECNWPVEKKNTKVVL